MDYQIIWFLLIAILFIGYFVLEGFDFGVGMLLPFIAKDDIDRRVVSTPSALSGMPTRFG
jgi:cytochrome bd ubiquinol oxidase subunit II